MGVRPGGAEASVMQIGSGHVLITNENELARVVLRGDFDLANVPALAAAVADSLCRTSDLLVDLEGVTFLDRQLLQWLVDLRRDVHRRNGRMLVRPSKDTRRLLTVLQMTHEFELVCG
jgi:anti-anti-sigma factor